MMMMMMMMMMIGDLEQDSDPTDHQADREQPLPPDPPTPAPRRSTRVTRKPYWMKSMRCQQVTTTPHQPEWLQRAAYLQNLNVSGPLALDKNQLSK